MEKLTCAQAKQLDLVDYLASIGHYPDPAMSRNGNFWYLSPLRKERTPSFKVNRVKNIWFDHGIGRGGDLIDFGVLYYQCSISEFLKIINPYQAFGNFSFQPPTTQSPFAGEKKKENPEQINVLAARPLKDEVLLRYLNERGIPDLISQSYLKEVAFRLYGKVQVTIGFENNSGGYELRSATFKGASSPKDITFINDVQKGSINVLEGFTDFLSLLTLTGEQQSSFLVLNSLAFLSRSFEALKGYEKVQLYLDHDAAGRRATSDLMKELPQAKDLSLFYHRYKDLNDYVKAESNHLKHQQSPQQNLDIKLSKPPDQVKEENTETRQRKRRGLRR